jgi:hypothetical protein
MSLLRCHSCCKTGDSTLKSVRFVFYAIFLWTATASFAQSSVDQATEAQSAGLSAPATAEIEHLMGDFHQPVAADDDACVIDVH